MTGIRVDEFRPKDVVFSGEIFELYKLWGIKHGDLMGRLENLVFNQAVECLRGLETCQRKEFVNALMVDAVAFYVETNSFDRLDKILQALPKHLHKTVLELMKNHTDPPKGSPNHSKVISRISGFTKKRESKLQTQLDSILEYFPEFHDAIHFEAHKALSDVELAKVRKDQSGWSTTFGKANRRIFVQGGAPGR